MKLNLKAARVNARLTQKEAAKKLDISQRALHNYENGYSEPKQTTIANMILLYHVNYEDLNFSRSENPIKSE